ncbi:rhodanese-like domain-containing protein [Patescibacteria group bacterium]|jgi:rhodanese-related sulfurtransferase|nr:rhodanese-like domain-containing protein [Patescibacteria group bacterium]
MKHISISAFQQTLEAEKSNSTVEFINVCTPDEYKAKHIEGVKSMPLDQLAARLSELQEKKTIYVHCRSGNRSKRAIEELERLGVKAELVNVEGGLMAWETAGLKTASTSSRIPLTQQVFIVAGSLILLGVVLTYVGGVGFLLLPGFIGAGLVFAGLTGWCGMALLLSKMPWNKQ